MNTIRLKQVAAKTSLAEQTIRNWVCQGKFPRPFKLGGVCVWDENDLDQWLLNQKKQQQGDIHESK